MHAAAQHLAGDTPADDIDGFSSHFVQSSARQREKTPAKRTEDDAGIPAMTQKKKVTQLASAINSLVIKVTDVGMPEKSPWSMATHETA